MRSNYFAPAEYFGGYMQTRACRYGTLSIDCMMSPCVVCYVNCAVWLPVDKILPIHNTKIMWETKLKLWCQKDLG